MGQDQITQLLQQGIAAARSNRPDIARGIFQQVVTMDPRNETAWAWLASIARNNKERLVFLKRLWEINPQNDFALKGLRALGIDPGGEQQSTPQTAVPFLDDARFARAQQAVDDFLRRYTPEPVDQLRINWEHRQRQRYGEAGARRLRRVVYSVAALVFVLFVSAIIFVLSQVDILGSGGNDVAFATRVPSQTPVATLTPTLGGPTPTPFPEVMAFAATSIPAGLDRGSALGLSSPTPIQPRPNVNIERALEDALGYYAIGDYETAADMLSEDHANNNPHCYPSLVYFEALSYAQLDQFARAENLLEQAQSYVPDRGYNSCQNSPLMAAGLAEVSYLQSDFSQALTLSEQALADNADLVTAMVTKGQSELALGQLTEAWQTVSRGLEEYPEDTNLLLLAARIELANAQANSALNYIGQALYIDPDLHPALVLQVEAYLMLGDESASNPQRRLQAFGLAVRSAQLLLQYYEGDPTGYLYLAKARMGEGNDDLAETALTRVIAVEDQLPESAASVVEEVFQLRGELYFHQGRFEAALSDLETYANRAETVNMQAVEMLMRSALKANEFSTARQWIAYLLNRQPNNPEYQLLQTKVWVELCALYPDELTCQYDSALDVLSDSFIASVQRDLQRADAYSYRAQARYHTIERQSAVLSDEQRTAALQAAVDDSTRALAIRESVIDHYYRGLSFEALEDAARAYEEFQWVNYWHSIYPYPFINRDFETRFAELKRVVKEAEADQIVTVELPASSAPPDDATPDAQSEATESPEATEMPEDTEASLPEPTIIPPNDIP